MKKSRMLSCLAACCLAFGGTARADHVQLTYDAVHEQLLVNSATFPILGNPHTPGDAVDHVYQLTNNTGQPWTDFHFLLALASGNGTFFFPTFAAGGYDGTAYEGPGDFVVSADLQRLDVVNLDIADGQVFVFSLDSDAFELTGTYDVYGTPSVDGGSNGAPEPAPLALLGIALAAWVGSRRRAWLAPPRRRVLSGPRDGPPRKTPEPFAHSRAQPPCSGSFGGRSRSLRQIDAAPCEDVGRIEQHDLPAGDREGLR